MRPVDTPSPGSLLCHTQVGFARGQLLPATRKLLRQLGGPGRGGGGGVLLTHIHHLLPCDPDSEEEGAVEELVAYTGGAGSTPKFANWGLEAEGSRRAQAAGGQVNIKEVSGMAYPPSAHLITALLLRHSLVHVDSCPVSQQHQRLQPLPLQATCL